MKVVVHFISALLLALSLSAHVPANPQEPPPYDIQLSRTVAEILLLHKVDPKEKCIGMAARVTGTVVLDVQIDVHGSVLHPVVISGPKMLHQAALDAVRQYKYRPYVLKGRPVLVETIVLVPFTLKDACR
jgi:protein TonB